MSKFLIGFLIYIIFYFLPVSFTTGCTRIIPDLFAIGAYGEQSLKEFNMPLVSGYGPNVINIKNSQRHSKETEKKGHGRMLGIKGIEQAAKSDINLHNKQALKYN
jgi:hypothetical protein